MTTVRSCGYCGGAGRVVTEKCTSCGGSGYVRRKRTATFKVPAGIDNGQSLVQTGQGDCGSNGGPNGDLYAVVSVKPHKLFEREGYNLYLEYPITFTQAALGADVDIPALHGTVKHHIPEGTQSGTEIRLSGYGIQRLNSSLKGDLIVRVKVEVPRHLNDKQRELLKQFEEASTGKEYQGKRSFLDKLKDVFN